MRRALFGFSLCLTGLLLAVLSLSASSKTEALSKLAQAPKKYPAFGVQRGKLPVTPISGAWSVVPSSNAADGGASELFAVACASTLDCWAVGKHQTANANQTLIEHWNGVVWRIIDSPNTSPTQDNVLVSLTCVTASDCWAVGSYQNSSSAAYQTLIEHWNGTAWSIVSSPNVATDRDHHLNGVTCVTASDCWAVGQRTAEVGEQTLVQHWDGVAWSTVKSPNPGPVVGTSAVDVLRDVSCTSDADCWAVGYYHHGVDQYVTLVERWNGSSWTVVDSPNVSGAFDNEFFAVACNSPVDCWAAGYSSSDGDSAQTLIERWDGISWTIVPSPNSSAGFNELFGLACASPQDCWAVGWDLPPDTGKFRTLTEHWNGTAWTIVPSPNNGVSDKKLQGVMCLSGSDCWGVGNYISQGLKSLVEHFRIEAPLTQVVSRKTHGTAGTFDIDLPRTGPIGIECRFAIGGNYQMVFTFAADIMSIGSTETNTGSISSTAIGPNPNQIAVNLTGIPTGEYVAVALNNVQDVNGGIGDASGTMGLLIADVTGNGVINSTDLAVTKFRNGRVIDTTTFRTDIQPNGSINSADVTLTKLHMGQFLP